VQGRHASARSNISAGKSAPHGCEWLLLLVGVHPPPIVLTESISTTTTSLQWQDMWYSHKFSDQICSKTSC
jgi:hypothetical protein